MDTAKIIAKHCVVTGKVQGVFFRQGTYQKANELGLKGWVRNLDNGHVECYICGEEKAVESLCEWLWEGPSAAKVDEVKTRIAPVEARERFEIIR